LTLVDRQ